ncbi:hypothetical protein MKX01_021140 [Papaver californicum]|nr:hypothetical protein MKX01_021140 [Papaver californicum]
MNTRKILVNIDLRLRDIFAGSEPFGNVFVVLVGDIRQLPPVFDTLLYIKGGRELQLTGSFSYSVFEQCVRLDTVFRQSGVEESLFRDALDYAMLTMEEKNNFKHALRVFPTKFDTAIYNHQRLILPSTTINAFYNHQRLKDLGYPVARISSKNNCKIAKSAASDEAKGLVMLHKNLSTQYGFVNGSMGTIVDVVYLNGEKSPTDMPVAVMVEFDKYIGQQLYERSNLVINFGDNMSADSVTIHFVLGNHGSQKLRIDT